MKWQIAITFAAIVLLLRIAPARSSQDTIGPNGINSIGFTTFTGQPLNGNAMPIGMVEIHRPGKPAPEGADDFQHSNPTIIPEAVYLHNNPDFPPANQNIENHPEYVAGVMISTDFIATGVATGANLYASAFVGDIDVDAQAAQSADFIAIKQFGFVSAINLSFSTGSAETVLDGNSLLTEFVDWSASHHDVLYVVGNRNQDNPPGVSKPIDNFNGITVASTTKDMTGHYSLVDPESDFTENSYGVFNRTFVSLLAPGDNIQVTGLGNIPTTQTGTSFAAPHVTGTVALLQQYGQERSIAGDAKFFGHDWERHEVMKAVLLNSANKIKDDGTRTVNGIQVPLGGFLGMDRTVLDKTVDPSTYPDGKNWLQSEGFLDNETDGLTPLDPHMGAGALDASRALKQYSAGQYTNNLGPAQIPAIGWDYQNEPGVDQARKYQFSQPLVGGSFVSITLAYDRTVTFDFDGGATIGEYDIGDTFTPSESFVPGQDQRNDLDLYLLPKGATSIDNPIAFSQSSESTIEHLFAQIPTTGEYEFWVYQFDDPLGIANQHYAVAWWADPVIATTQGDYNGDGMVNAQDYITWREGFGGFVSAATAADGNGNGAIDAADYVVWRKALTAGSGSNLASVPEPAALSLALVGLIGGLTWMRSLKNIT